MHRLLTRQIRKYLKKEGVSEFGISFIEAVDAAYKQAESDRKLLEHSVNLAGQELLERNRMLQNRIKQHEKTQKNLETTLSMLQSTLESLAEGVLIINLNRRPVFHNKQLNEAWGLGSDDENIELMTSDMIYEKIEEKLVLPDYFKMQRVRIDYVHEKFSMTHETHDGQVIECEGRFHQDIGYIWCFRNVTKQFRYEEKLQYQAYHDSLTGLPNRFLLLDRISQGIVRSKRYHTKLALLFFDLDSFKKINDNLGHDTGDQVLLEVSKRMTGVIRREDTLARLGGDEFVLLCELKQDSLSVETLVTKIIKLFDKPFLLERQLYLTTSLGIAIYPKDGDNPTTLLKHADIAMYQAKSEGQNVAKFFVPEFEHITSETFQIESHLRQAVNEQRLEVHYQPKFDLSNGRLVGFEALLRWPQSKELTLPSQFIPVAEQSGLMPAIGIFVIHEVCAQISQLRSLGHQDVDISINLSASQLLCKGTFEAVIEQIRSNGIPASSLVIEVTENIIFDQVEHCLRLLHQFKSKGIKIHLDDFGTGYSSLNYLKILPLDAIKIDREIIKDIHSSDQDLAIVKTMIALGHALGLKIIAEGVERIEQLDILQKCQCDAAQGFLLGKPARMLNIDALGKDHEVVMPDIPNSLIKKSR